ncbi:MAG: hypothetical protein M5T61_15535 [Acidimicrobiia bacterium]|nr:hypothetical protein [Acidimicrobiia bacterium]
MAQPDCWCAVDDHREVLRGAPWNSTPYVEMLVAEIDPDPTCVL